MVEDLHEYFENLDEEIAINEAYDNFMDAIEYLSNKVHKNHAYNLLGNREYIKCFDFLWKHGIPDVNFVSKLSWGLRNFYAYNEKSGK